MCFVNAESSKKRLQSATEYLITYSWALLIIAVVIVLLYLYIAVPSRVVPSSCVFVTGAQCVDIVVGTNITTHATKLALFLVNTQTFPILKPTLFASFSGQNTSEYSCGPSYVLAGGAVICIINVPKNTTLGQFLTGSLYLKANYCGLVPNSSSTSACASTPT